MIMNRALLISVAAATILLAVILAVSVFAKDDDKQETKKATSPKKAEKKKQQSKSASVEQDMVSDSSASKSKSNNNKNNGDNNNENNGDNNENENNNDEEPLVVDKVFASQKDKALQNRLLFIKGSLTNMTRTVRDPATNTMRKVFPADVARIAINGGAYVFFSDSHGAFQLHVPVPNPSSGGASAAVASSSSSSLSARILVHSVDVDWHTAHFPRVMIEVDEFANFRAYVDGDGRIVASRGKFGVDPKSRRQFEVVEDAVDDTDYAFANQFLTIACNGDMQYLVPRQEFSAGLLAFVKQPMVLMMVVTAFMVVVMPRLVDQNEMKASMREMQSMTQGKDGAAAGGGGSSKTAAVRDKK